MILYGGKVMGAILGYIFGGPFGAVVGLVIGQYFDVSRSTSVHRMGAKRHTSTQDAFFRATFTVMGHLAKADGRVSEDEIRAARVVMQNMMLTEKMKNEAIRLFTYGKSPNFNLDAAIGDLLRYSGRQTNLLRMFLEIQFQAAIADGYLGPNKRSILEFLCLRLGFNINDFTYFSRAHYQRSREHQRAERRTTRRDTALTDAYKTLEIPISSTDPEVKRAYRKQMSRNHPDKLVSKGLPEEMMKLATAKTQRIKEAYEQIRSARGIK